MRLTIMGFAHNYSFGAAIDATLSVSLAPALLGLVSEMPWLSLTVEYREHEFQ
jgi:hypothetical protein